MGEHVAILVQVLIGFPDRGHEDPRVDQHEGDDLVDVAKGVVGIEHAPVEREDEFTEDAEHEGRQVVIDQPLAGAGKSPQVYDAGEDQQRDDYVL